MELVVLVGASVTGARSLCCPQPAVYIALFDTEGQGKVIMTSPLSRSPIPFLGW